MKYAVICGKSYIKSVEEGTFNIKYTENPEDAMFFYEKELAQSVASVCEHYFNDIEGTYEWKVIEHPAPWSGCVSLTSAIDRYIDTHPYTGKNTIDLRDYIVVLFNDMQNFLGHYIVTKPIKRSKTGFFKKLRHKRK